MTRAYPSDQKAAAMVALERNRGNVPLTAQQTGIPVRTLYTWQCNSLPYLQQYTPLVPKPTETPAFESDLDALAFIRQNILGELSRLSASLKDDVGFSTPYQRALVLSQLMDKLLKLDLHLKPYTPQEPQRVRIEYVDKHGNIHDSRAALRSQADEEDAPYSADEWNNDVDDDEWVNHNHDDNPAA